LRWFVSMGRLRNNICYVGFYPVNVCVISAGRASPSPTPMPL